MEISEDNSSAHQHSQVEEVISVNKFVILSIFSLGLYPFWWTYKAWRFFQEKDELDIIAPARTLFSYIFLSSLFKRILGFARENGYAKTFHPALLHAAYVIIILSSYLPEPYFLISLLNFVIFIQPFEALNFAKMNTADIVAVEKTSFNFRQIVLMLIGGLILFSGVFGLIFGID
jgi:hypothetical protein